MITNSNGSSPLHILWPNRYEISHAANLGYNDLVTDEQSIANWDWIKMRLQKATTADEQRRCGYDKCDDPITIENKKNLMIETIMEDFGENALHSILECML